MNLTQKLKAMNACDEAMKWVVQMNGSDPEKLWNECERGDWMLWLVSKLDIDRKQLVFAACQCARLAEHLMTDERSIKAIEMAEAWTRGEVTEDELRHAYAAAYAAARAAARAADAGAAYAARAARAADAADAARKNTLKRCADITRQHFTFNEVYKCLEIK